MNKEFVKTKVISIITPAYNEEKNLPLFFTALKETLNLSNIEWEWIIVDDHSVDNTFQVAKEIATHDARVFVYRLSRNHGSHIALRCGLTYAKGNCAIAIASDLQDPLELIPQLVAHWCQNIPIVWAMRRNNRLKSRSYYWLIKKISGLKHFPTTGADCFLIDRKIIDIILQCDERNCSLFMLLASLGFKQDYVVYDKKMRHFGKTGWSFQKNIKLLIDSFISFSYLPIQFFSIIGVAVATLGFMYALLIFCKTLFTTSPVPGWASLTIVVLILGGVQMMMLGILGEYIWRAFDQSRRRPVFLIEDYFQFEKNNAKARVILEELSS